MLAKLVVLLLAPVLASHRALARKGIARLCSGADDKAAGLQHGHDTNESLGWADEQVCCLPTNAQRRVKPDSAQIGPLRVLVCCNLYV